jgi:hypothetical protein
LNEKAAGQGILSGIRKRLGTDRIVGVVTLLHGTGSVNVFAEGRPRGKFHPSFWDRLDAP